MSEDTMRNSETAVETNRGGGDCDECGEFKRCIHPSRLTDGTKKNLCHACMGALLSKHRLSSWG